MTEINAAAIFSWFMCIYQEPKICCIIVNMYNLNQFLRVSTQLLALDDHLETYSCSCNLMDASNHALRLFSAVSQTINVFVSETDAGS